VNTEVRRKKVLADLWDVRVGVAAALVVTALGCIWLRVSPATGAWQLAMLRVSPATGAWQLAMLISVVAVAQSVMPLATARAAEAPMLRALGASDNAASRFAIVEGGLLGGLAGLAAVALGPSLGLSLVWFAACAATGALCGLITARRGVQVSSQ
jgi:hypothetical protein